MKIIPTLAFLLLINIVVFAQNLEIRDGLYYKKGMLYTGTHIEYFENGNKSLVLNIRDGLEHGSLEYFYPSGIQKEYREYNDGKKTGIWITWNEAGVKIAEAGYKDDIKDGAWYVWDNKGTMLYEMHYTLGKKSATWRQWDENGKLTMEKVFED